MQASVLAMLTDRSNTLEVGDNIIDFQLQRHVYVHGGYRIPFRNVTLLPSFWYRSDGREPQLESTLKTAILGGRMRLGASYRHKDGVVPIVEVLRTYKGAHWFLGYSYDITLNPLRNTSFGSHEIQLGVCYKIPEKIKQWKNTQNLGPYNYF